jgi:hypothetical protein
MELAGTAIGGSVTVKVAAPPPPVKPAATIPYNPAAYVPGGSSPKVAIAIEVAGITTPGPTPVQVPVTILAALPPIPPVLVGNPPPTPAPAPPPTVPSGLSLSHADLEILWELAGGAAEYADTAAAIAEAESGGCQYALAGPFDIRPAPSCHWTKTSKENSCCFWQINLDAHPSYSAPSIFEKLTNATAAVAISNQGTDFGPWTTYTNGAYKAYLQGNVGAGSGGTSGTSSAAPVKIAAPAGVQKAWGSIIDLFATGVPANQAKVQSRAASLIGVFK